MSRSGGALSTQSTLYTIGEGRRICVHPAISRILNNVEVNLCVLDADIYSRVVTHMREREVQWMIYQDEKQCS